MKALNRTFAFATVATLASAGALVAQVPGTVIWHGFSMSLSYGISKVAVVDITNDGDADAVVLLDGKVGFFANPDYMRAYPTIEISSAQVSATDIAALDQCTSSGLHGVLAVGSYGLKKIWRNASTGAFESSVIDNSAWVDARQVRARDLNGDGYTDIVGLDSAGTSLLVLAGDGQGGFSNYAGGSGSYSISSWVSTGGGRQIELAQYTPGYGGAADQVDVAVMSDEYVKVIRFQLNGSSQTVVAQVSGSTHTATSGYTCVGMAVTDHLGRDREQIAMLKRSNSSPYNEYLVVFGENNGTTYTDSTLGLGPIHTVGLAAGSLGGESAARELVFAHSTTPDQFVLRNVSTTTASSATYTTNTDYVNLVSLAPFETDFSSNQSTPGIGDFDGDGDNDLLLFSQPTDQVFLFRADVVDESDYKIYPREDGLFFPNSSSQNTQILAPLAEPDTYASGCNAIDVVVWRGEYASAESATTQPTPFAHYYIDRENFENTTFDLVIDTEEEFTVAQDLEVELRYVYSMQVRQVNRDAGTGKILQAWPSTIITVTASNASSDEMKDEWTYTVPPWTGSTAKRKDMYQEEEGGGGCLASAVMWWFSTKSGGTEPRPNLDPLNPPTTPPAPPPPGEQRP